MWRANRDFLRGYLHRTLADLDQITETNQEIKNQIAQLRDILDLMEKDPFFDPFALKETACSIWGNVRIYPN
jgi:hypothetical protein